MRGAVIAAAQPGVLATHSPPARLVAHTSVHIFPPPIGSHRGRKLSSAPPPPRPQLLSRQSCLLRRRAQITELFGACHAYPTHPHPYTNTALQGLDTENLPSRDIDAHVPPTGRRGKMVVFEETITIDKFLAARGEKRGSGSSTIMGRLRAHPLPHRALPSHACALLRPSARIARYLSP